MTMRARILLAVATASMAAMPVAAQDEPTLGAFTVAGLSDVCVPVIERGEALGEAASSAGFLEADAEQREQFGADPAMVLWLFEFAEALLVVARDGSDAGSPCTIMASVPAGRIGDVRGEIGSWLGQSRSDFELVAEPARPEARDAEWRWQREVSGALQILRVVVNRHGDGTATAVTHFGLLAR